MNIFCLIFGHSPKHPKTQLFCRRKFCDYKFPGYCEHKWVYSEYKYTTDIYLYNSDPYAPYPVLEKPKEGYGKWISHHFSNLKCIKCEIRKFSMDYEKYLSGEWN